MNCAFITSYERDNETDLDFAQVRYYSKNYGRFTSPDPLLTSATIYAPQTWNRYAYTLNNPTNNTDPLGLFVWNESLGGDVTDEDLLRNAGDNRRERRRAQRTIDQRNRIRNAMTAARNSANREGLTDAQRNNIRQSVDSYGAERTANGVTVGIGELRRGTAAQATVTGFNYNEASNTITAQVSVIFDDDTSGNDITVSVAHEGRHVADGQEYAGALTADVRNGTNLALNSTANRTRFDREVRAYNVSSSVAQGLGLESWSVDGNEIWNRGWSEQRRDTLRTQGIERLLRTSDTYRLTPQDPGNRYQIPTNPQ